MRKLYALVLSALLLPAGAAAQDTPSGERQRPAVTEQQARTVAVARVRGDLAAGKLNTWGTGTGGGIRSARVTAAGALFNPTGGKNGLYVVGVTAPGARGHVRVLVDAQSGAVLDTKVSSWSWGVTPDWWVKGLSAPPTEKKGEDTLSVKGRSGGF